MKRASVRILLVLFCASVFLPQGFSVQAADCTQTDKIFSGYYDVTYKVNPDGLVSVSQRVSLKNLVADCFASEYSLKINTNKVKDVTGSDALGPLRIDTTGDASVTTLVAFLNEEVTGAGRAANFTLNYVIEGLAQKEGQIWNLSVPRIAAGETVTDSKLVVSAPEGFGEVFSVFPDPATTEKKEGQIVLTFGKDKINDKGVFVSFGTDQQIDFEFKVPLENKKFLGRTFLIPLPPDSEKQQTLIESITPKPKRIFGDALGNYFAEYRLGPRSYTEVAVKGSVRIASEKTKFATPTKIDKDYTDQFLKESPFIQIEERTIQEKAKQLATPFEIYKFVKSYLSIDSGKIAKGEGERKGAFNLLEKSQGATNLNFVDLFVALSRAAGIPTREVFGVALSQNQSAKPIFIGDPLNTKNLHAWAQVYDKESGLWLDVDPTWGATSGVDYFGKNLPERFTLLYTTSLEGTENLKNLSLLPESIKSTYGTQKKNFTPKVVLDVNVDQAVAGFPAVLEVVLKNTTGLSVVDGVVSLDAGDINIVGEESTQVGTLVPFEEKKVRLKIRGGDLFKSVEDNVKVKFEAKSGSEKILLENEKQVKVASFFSLGTQQVLLILIIALLLVGIFSPKIVKRKN